MVLELEALAGLDLAGSVAPLKVKLDAPALATLEVFDSTLVVALIYGPRDDDRTTEEVAVENLEGSTGVVKLSTPVPCRLVEETLP